MSAPKRKLLEQYKKFFAVREIIEGSMGDISPVPLNVLQVGPAGCMAVVGKKNGLSLAFFDFTKSKDHYAEITADDVWMDVGVQPEFLLVALLCATISLEWWIKIPGESALPSYLRRDLNE